MKGLLGTSIVSVFCALCLLIFFNITTSCKKDNETIEQPKDTVPPVITLKGKNPVSVEKGSVYVDAGATAYDDVDGDITSKIVVTNPVNTSQVGTYIVRYNVSDNAGNKAKEVTRTVSVVIF